VERSGEQIEIAWGEQRAVVTSVGATLRSYTVGDRAVIDGFPADQVCPGARGQVLIPWPNRVARGRYQFGGEREQLPVDEPELGNAIHGLARFAEWRVDSSGGDRARLRYRMAARPGYPFPLDLSVEYRLTEGGLAVSFEAINLDKHACPFGAGAHPYFLLPGARADQVELELRASEWLEVDERSIPIRRRAVEGSAFDFRRARPIGELRLDHAFCGLARDSDGNAEVLLGAQGRALRVWLDRRFDFVQVYTGDTLPDATRRRRSVAVEPMTCAPNAFNSGDGLLVLPPGGLFEARWGVRI
jgi:aldose 1-epimerase